MAKAQKIQPDVKKEAVNVRQWQIDLGQVLYRYCWWKKSPPGMYETLEIMG